jgi:Flp pilus assembly secretin CpaC
VGNPVVVDVSVATKNTIEVNALTVGSTTLIFWADGERRSLAIQVFGAPLD